MLFHAAALLQSPAEAFATSTAPMGSAQPGDAKPTQSMGKQGFVRSIPKTKRPALLQTAVTLLLHAGFAGRMAHMGSAHLMGAIPVLSKVVCATGTFVRSIPKTKPSEWISQTNKQTGSRQQQSTAQTAASTPPRCRKRKPIRKGKVGEDMKLNKRKIVKVVVNKV